MSPIFPSVLNRLPTEIWLYITEYLSGNDLKSLRRSNSDFVNIASERLFQVFLIDLSELPIRFQQLEYLPTDPTLVDSSVLKLPHTLRICSSRPHDRHDYAGVFWFWKWKGLVSLVERMTNLRSIELSIAGFGDGIPNDGVTRFLYRICGLHQKANIYLSLSHLSGYRSGTIVRYLSNLRVLRLSGDGDDTPQLAAEMAMMLERCPQLESFTLQSERRSLDDVLAYVKAPLVSLRELSLATIEPPCEIWNLAKLPSLRKLVLENAMCWNPHVRQDVWTSLKHASICLEEITMEVMNLSFFDYLIANGKNIRILNVYLPGSPLHLEPEDSGQSDEMNEYTVEDLAEVFWGYVLPVIMSAIEFLTLCLQTANSWNVRVERNGWSPKSLLLRLWTLQYLESRGFIPKLKTTNLKSLTLMATVDDELDTGWQDGTFRAIAGLARSSNHHLTVNLHLLHNNSKKFERDVQYVRREILNWRCPEDISFRNGSTLVLMSRFHEGCLEKTVGIKACKHVGDAAYSTVTFHSKSNRWVIQPGGKLDEVYRRYAEPLFSEHVFHL